MLTLCGGQVECLWDEVLPIEARELPEDLAPAGIGVASSVSAMRSVP
jgi:hypothetical protein